MNSPFMPCAEEDKVNNVFFLETAVIFLNIYNTGETAEEKRAKRQKAFQHFTQYRGASPVGFDYKKELSEYRNERYDHIG